MFIRPNEFEAQLGAAKPMAPFPGKSHRAAGAAFLLVIGPVLLAWIAILACWTATAFVLRAPVRIARFLTGAADYAGYLVSR